MVLQFAACTLDVDGRQLGRDGREQHLTPKAFDLLVTLVEARPRVVSKTDLINRLWPDTFVSEANLPVLVGEVREAIGDNARTPALIRTHHRHGYSFIGSVLEVARKASERVQGPTPVLRVGQRRVLLGAGPITVGRDTSADVVINDASVSRHHARITVRGLSADVEDLESKNGTRVGGERIRSRRLESGDQVWFGAVEAEFSVELPEGGTTCTLAVVDAALTRP
jgi:DNA-binding winged helix-turn-helix (wHTH) protein